MDKDNPFPTQFLGVEKLVSCRTWNAEIVGSNPTAQTKHHR